MHCTILIASAFVALGTAVPTTSSKSCTPSKIHWKNCAAENDTPGLQCANISLPIDWSTPCSSDTVRVALAMSPARTKSQRIDSLFFNTGGPGGLVITELVGNGSGLVPFSEEIRDRFDIVAMDPRGFGRSQGIARNSSAYNDLNDKNFFPENQEEFDTLYEASSAFEKSCQDLTGPLLEFVDSRSVARDFEAVRVALGGEKVNFFAISYGTMIGQAYLELFPENLRTMVLHGDVEHSQRQQYALSTISKGYEATLNQFFEWCDTNSTCAIHNKTLKSAHLFDDLIVAADAKPIPAPGCADAANACAPTVSGFDSLSVGQEGLLIKYPIPGSPLLDSVSFPALAKRLHKAYYGKDATEFSRIVLPPGSDNISSVSSVYVEAAVLAAEWNTTISTLKELRYINRGLASAFPHTGGKSEIYNAMVSGIGWSSPPTFPERVPVFANTSTPVFMMNAYYDPEAPYDWAMALQGEISKSVLVSRDGVGHTSYCLKGESWELMNEYLLDLKFPAPNTVVSS